MASKCAADAANADRAAEDCNSSLGQVRRLDYLNSRNSFSSRFTVPREDAAPTLLRRCFERRARYPFRLHGDPCLSPEVTVLARRSSVFNIEQVAFFFSLSGSLRVEEDQVGRTGLIYERCAAKGGRGRIRNENNMIIELILWLRRFLLNLERSGSQFLLFSFVLVVGTSLKR